MRNIIIATCLLLSPIAAFAGDYYFGAHGQYEKIMPGTGTGNSAFGGGGVLGYQPGMLGAFFQLDATFYNLPANFGRMTTLWLGVGPKLTFSYLYLDAILGLIKQSYSGNSSSSSFYGIGGGLEYPLTDKLAFTLGLDLRLYSLGTAPNVTTSVKNLELLFGLLYHL